MNYSAGRWSDLMKYWSRTFREAFCEHYRCPDDQYEKRVFWMSLYRHALPFAALVYPLSPKFFFEDLDAIRDLGTARNSIMFTHDLNLFHGRNQRVGGFLRGTLYLRVSGHRLIHLKRQVLPLLTS